MEKLKKFVSHKQFKLHRKVHSLEQLNEPKNVELDEWIDFPVHSVDHSLPPDCPSFPHDPQLLQDVLSTVEESYYSMAFDSGRYEIENSAGPTCRQLEDLKRRLQVLDNQNKAVSRRVSELILDKHPLYEAELKGVLLLQADNWETLELCRRIRHSLKSSENVLVLSRLTVLRNYRRRLRLQKLLHIMRHIRSLQNSLHRLDALLMKGAFYTAIEVHRESLVLLEDYRQYRCVEPIHLKLKVLGSRIDDLLDTELEKSCENFSESSYATVQHAFELLGSTQTMFAQLQMHYITAVQRGSLSAVQSYLVPSEDADEVAGGTPKYAELCNRLSMQDLPLCLSDACQNIWLILVCYHRTTLWHQNRACSNPPDKVEGGALKNSQSPKPLENQPGVHDSVKRTATTTTAFGVSSSKHSGFVDTECDEEEVVQPQLIRQWHEYVASKLVASRNRIWSESSGRIETILKAMGRYVTDMSFKQISAVLHTVNHFVKIGQEFSGNPSSDLLEVLRTSIHNFFKEFHRKHLERLRVFLGNETWEFCPVKSSFTVLDLQEYRSLSNFFQGSGIGLREQTANSSRGCVNPTPVTTFGDTEQTFFKPPYCLHQFPVQFDTKPTPQHASLPNAANASQPSDTTSSLPPAPSNVATDRHTGPLLSSTTLEVLRLIGRYLQMMHLLQPIAAEVMHCICQVFDYYLYSIFAFFGPIQSMDSIEIPDRLRLTLKRINERLIAPENHPAVAKGSTTFTSSLYARSKAVVASPQMCEPGLEASSFSCLDKDRFPLPLHEPMHVFNSVSRLMETMMDQSATSPNMTALCSSYLQAHFVGVESVICLADILESMLLPHLSACLPERKRGLTSVFREQALTAARQLREPCATQIASQLVSLLMTSDTTTSTAVTSLPNPSGTSIASGFSRIWSGTANEKDPVGSRPSRLVTSARNDAASEPNWLTTSISFMQWTARDVATTPSSYVQQLHTLVLSPFGRIMHTLTHRLGLSESTKLTMWNAFLTYIGNMLLNAYGQVQLCSDEGRGQMLLDVQSIAAFAEMESKIRSFPNLDRVIEYIQAFYVPVHEWEHWLTHTGTKYSRTQLTGLAHCLARGDRRQRQRLLNTINQIYGTSGVQSSTGGSNTNT